MNFKKATTDAIVQFLNNNTYESYFHERLGTIIVSCPEINRFISQISMVDNYITIRIYDPIGSNLVSETTLQLADFNLLDKINQLHNEAVERYKKYNGKVKYSVST